jgi:hypothetical protein
MVIALLRKHVYLIPALAIVLLAASSAWLYGGKPHYPIVRAVVGEEVTLTFIDLPWNDVRKCEEAHKKVADLLRAQCPSCQLVLSECRQQLEPPWEKAFRGEPSIVFAVHTDTQRITIEADHETARGICNDMATQIENQGKQHARCVAPQS